jgi:ankyrin repeat protein
MVTIIDVLIKSAADVNAFSKDEETCLHMAAKKGSVELINKLNNSFNFKLDLNPRNRVCEVFER